MKAGTERGIRIRIVQSEPTGSTPDFDTKELEVKGKPYFFYKQISFQVIYSLKYITLNQLHIFYPYAL